MMKRKLVEADTKTGYPLLLSDRRVHIYTTFFFSLFLHIPPEIV